MARRGPPGGPEVGEPGRLPPWWSSGFPPADNIHLLRHVGWDWVAMYGTPTVVDRPFTSILRKTPELILAYQAGGPDNDATGPIAHNYSCIWRQVKIAPGEPPRAKRTWETLSPSTRSSYRGTMKRRLLLRTEPQFKHYYETAPDLSLLRRHRVKTVIVPNVGRLSFPHGKDMAEYPWLATWQR